MTTAQRQRMAFRTAGSVREWLAGRRKEDTIQLPEQEWARVMRLRRQISEAKRRGWQHAARRLHEPLQYELQSCQYRIASAISVLATNRQQQPLPSEAEIFQELVALDQEFDEIDYSAQDGELCVTTEPIVLEGIRFGPFRICLDLNSTADSPPYRVVALEPHPAEIDEGTTHPHVRDEHLCEGEGRQAIQAALQDGRLADFFLIVSRLLGTYAQGSAFVELEDWYGASCSDCGCCIGQEDSCYCDSCGDRLCESCQRCCGQCSTGYCSNCINRCQTCESDCCSRCLAACSCCHNRVCAECRITNTCRSCHDHEQPEDEEQDQDSQTADPAGDAGSPLQPHRLGETAVPA